MEALFDRTPTRLLKSSASRARTLAPTWTRVQSSLKLSANQYHCDQFHVAITTFTYTSAIARTTATAKRASAIIKATTTSTMSRAIAIATITAYQFG